MSEPRLDDAVALVTGAGGGIGRAVCRRLAQAGALVVVNDIDAAAAEETAAVVRRTSGDRVLVAVGDIRETDVVDHLLKEVVAAFGHLDILVTCAGVLANAPVTETTDTAWDEVLDVHLGGTFKCVRAAVPHLRPGGAIVTVSSGAAWGSTRGHSNYAAAKAGILGLTRTLALELAPRSVRVNAIAPGAIDTAMTRATADQLGQTYAEYLKETAGRIPLGRIGQPEEVADVVCFLASPMAAYVTGQVLKVSGGP